MRFSTQAHKHYCSIDPHARQIYLCILDAAGATRRGSQALYPTKPI